MGFPRLVLLNFFESPIGTPSPPSPLPTFSPKLLFMAFLPWPAFEHSTSSLWPIYSYGITPPLEMALETKTTSLLRISLLTWPPPKHLYLCGPPGLSLLTTEATRIPLYPVLLPSLSCGAWHTWAQSMGP